MTATHVKKIASSENYRHALHGDLVPYQSFKVNVKKKGRFLFGCKEQVTAPQ
jgi:hypothetical protein